MKRTYKFAIDFGATVHPEVEAESEEEAERLAEEKGAGFVADWLNMRSLRLISVNPPEEE